MPPRRLSPMVPERRVRLRVDGRDVEALDGEPIAVALAASGRLVLGRSVKYHRPRGAACYAGRCEGCLMRVGGVPNVMTCRAPARDGAIVETQNVVGSAERDLLAATDWFFPGGMDHHAMFTFSKPINQLMQQVARRVAGVGELPSRLADAQVPAEVECDVLVCGAGAAGLEVAAACARRGLSTLVCEDSQGCGGALRIAPSDPEARRRSAALERAARDAGADVRVRTPVVAIYPTELDAFGHTSAVALAHGVDGLVVVRPRRVVIATGTADGSMAFPGSDLPGILSLRGACELLEHGVLPGATVALVGAHDAFGTLVAALEGHGATVLGPYAEHTIGGVRGRPSVRAIQTPDGEKKCDAVVLAPPPSAVYELAEQAGANVRWRDGAFVVDADERGVTASALVRAVGGCTAPIDASAQCAACAADLAEELSHAG